MEKKQKLNRKYCRAKGMRFESKVRKDLESKGWIVSKWQNNVEFNEVKVTCNAIGKEMSKDEIIKKSVFMDPVVCSKNILKGKLIPARQGRFRLTSTGFPDFICMMYEGSKKGYKSPHDRYSHPRMINDYEVDYAKGIKEPMHPLTHLHANFIIIGIECKSNGYLSKEEKLKCKWLLDNNIFSKILIASQDKYEDITGKKRKKFLIKFMEFK